ncbi:hypothetical protein BRD56_07870 [Thermoplasmatales archaeon SW_10_69_26]|jgi:uncharacterized Fe-S cluster-containing radical SAM superfamily protein|nr:MAG: hypothetical protein BRD56_07870 [Thermoplasmatales archaeon SW_10_69_26]
MYIEPEKDEDEQEIREMKVRIPSDFYMKLHSLKLLTGKQISEAVTEALDMYFTEESFNKRVEKNS